jgi:small subunit ribosomal protein S16
MVKMRLARRGRKNLALYDVVVADARAPRDGRFIEKIGTYNPNTNPALVELDEEKAFKWIMNGAQPTDTVRAMLSYRGVLVRKHLQVGVIKGALTQEQADEKFEAWKKEKAAKIQTKVDRLAAEKEKQDKEKLAAESKVKEARAEALKKRQQVAEQEAKTAEAAEEVTAESPAEIQETAEATPAQTETTGESPVEAPEESKTEETSKEAEIKTEAEPIAETPAAVEPKSEEQKKADSEAEEKKAE